MNDVLNLPATRPWASAFSSAKPFPHIVLDGLFADAALDQVVRTAPRRFWAWKNYTRKNGVTINKFAITKWRRLPDPAREVLAAINADSFVSFVRDVTGIEDLRPDPTLRGGGIHKIMRGGRLGVHIDFNRAEDGSYRRINLITYMNRDWPSDWGGDLELWNDEGCVIKVAPTWNRTVLFEASARSWHGHPYRLTCPKSAARLSLACYYFSSVPSQHARSEPHETLYHPLDPNPIHG